MGKGIAIANVYLEYGLQSEALLLLEESVINKVQTGLNFNSNGDVQLTDSGIDISTQGGEAIATGTINVSHSGGGGGDVGIFGNRLALINTNVDASGSNGGGNVFVGGDYQGKGNIPTPIWQQEVQILKRQQSSYCLWSCLETRFAPHLSTPPRASPNHSSQRSKSTNPKNRIREIPQLFSKTYQQS